MMLEEGKMILYIFVLMFLSVVEINGKENNFGLKYGDKCGDNRYCNVDKYFSCTKGICKCSRQDYMIYEENIGRCSYVAQSSCRETIHVRSESDESFEITKTCVQNSTCLEKGCTCLPGYNHIPGGECRKMTKAYGETCSGSEECWEGEYLACVNSKCDCNSNSIYESNPSSNIPLKTTYLLRGLKSCAGLLGEPCVGKEGFCVRGTVCNSERICECVKGQVAKNGSCYDGYGEKCSVERLPSKCSPQLNCINGECGCKYGTAQYLLPKNDKNSRRDEINSNTECVSYIGTSCSQLIQCPPNSTCSKPIGQLYERCVCNSGFVEVDGFCELSYGSFCNPTTSPKFKYYEKENGDEKYYSRLCDSRAHLSCVNNKCSCGSEILVYHEFLRECLIREGYKCRGRDDEDKCAQNSVCKFDKVNKSSTCICNEGFVTSKTRICVKEI